MGESRDVQLIYYGKVIEVAVHDYFQFDKKMKTDPKGVLVGTWELVSVLKQRAASAADIEDKNVIFCSGIAKKVSGVIYYGQSGEFTVAQARILQGDEFDFVAPHSRIALFVDFTTGRGERSEYTIDTLALWKEPEPKRLTREHSILLNIHTRSGLMQFWGITSQLNERFSGKGIEITLSYSNMQSHEPNSPTTGYCDMLLGLANYDQWKFLRCWSSINWAEAKFEEVVFLPRSDKRTSIKQSIKTVMINVGCVHPVFREKLDV